MLSWLFKKRAPELAARSAPLHLPAQAPVAAAASAAARSEARRVEGALWQARLEAARGDDAALLQLAQTAPLLEIKLAAVEALAGETALKAAEREFRSHDRRVHRVAKRRLDAAVAQREGRARAQALIETLAALNAGGPVPVNLLVALDRDWQALDAAHLAPEQPAQFAAGRALLDAAMRAHDEAQQAQRRWLAEAKQALMALQAELAQVQATGFDDGVAVEAMAETAREGVGRVEPQERAAVAVWEDEGGDSGADAGAAAPAALPGDLGHPAAAAATVPVARTAYEEAQALIDARPASPATDAMAAALRAALDSADRAAAEAAVRAQTRRDRLAAQAAAATAATAAPPPVVPRKARREPLPLPSADRLLPVEALLQSAESALAEGQIAALRQHLTALDVALGELRHSTRELPPAHPLLARRQALHAEAARLQGWQAWGGSQARESLADEAEALARLTLAAAEPEAPKLRLQAHGEDILALRQRWKDLDRLGAAAPQALWQRFDAALQTAYQPLAARQAAQNAARKENLAARLALLDALDAVGAGSPSPAVADATEATGAGDAGDTPAAAVDGVADKPLGDSANPALAAADAAIDPAAETNADPGSAHWKEQARALGAFQLAWRQLGPLEHSVPASARAALQQRLRDSVERIEAPLQQARREAEAVRERLIERAEALAQEAARPQNAASRDAIPRVRELQADWQHHARAVPLARAVETALWARFKAATDAVYAQREAALGAFEAGLHANLAAREALLERLSTALADTSTATPAGLERTLAEVERAWREPVELPRGAAGALESRFRELRAALQQRGADAQRAVWQAQCDALAGRLALCEEREGSVPADDLASRWASADSAAPPASLPTAWQRALAERWQRPLPAVAAPLAEAAFDDLLLQLEIALDLPAAPERQAARRQFKLRAMKDALEGRSAAASGPAQPAALLVAAWRQSGTSAAQRERLGALVAALRALGPDRRWV